MLEFADMTMRFVCDRGVSHEIVRHRLFSYAQESTRYCNYKGGVAFIIPCWVDLPEGEYVIQNTVPTGDYAKDYWLTSMSLAETTYIGLIEHANWKPQQARSVLPNSLKTEIVVKGNLREWMHFFKLRTHKKAHPQMQEVANVALEIARENVPVIFED